MLLLGVWIALDLKLSTVAIWSGHIQLTEGHTQVLSILVLCADELVSKLLHAQQRSELCLSVLLLLTDPRHIKETYLRLGARHVLNLDVVNEWAHGQVSLQIGDGVHVEELR